MSYELGVRGRDAIHRVCTTVISYKVLTYQLRGVKLFFLLNSSLLIPNFIFNSSLLTPNFTCYSRSELLTLFLTLNS
jgi:hypothetical protein